jgi:hypothetical protein
MRADQVDVTTSDQLAVIESWGTHLGATSHPLCGVRIDHWLKKKGLLPAGPVSEERQHGNSTATIETRTGV